MGAGKEQGEIDSGELVAILIAHHGEGCAHPQLQFVENVEDDADLCATRNAEGFSEVQARVDIVQAQVGADKRTESAIAEEIVEGQGTALAASNQLGAAQLFLAAARSAWISNSHTLSDAIANLSTRPSGVKNSARFGDLLQPTPKESFAEFIIVSERRTRALVLLRASSDPLTQELMRLRGLTNTVLFPASGSASGQAFDAAIAIAGLLNEDAHIAPGLGKALLTLATDANRGANPQMVEQALMDLMSLGQRFDWGQLATFVENINNTDTLRILTALVRRDESVPVVYAAVCMTGNGAGVARYLSNFSKTGLNDLRLSLSYGVGGVNQLLQSNRRLCDSPVCERMAALSARSLPTVGLTFALREPGQALAAKWFLYLLGGFFVAVAFHYARCVTVLEKPLEVRGFHVAREVVFALGFLLVVLLLSEPFLSQGSQKTDFPFRLRLPTVGSGFAAASTGAKPPIMNNESSLISLLLFFVLQAFLYVACLVKLAEIRRQRVSARVKLKLLKNEDHLFDAGLYLGLVGTIISLILFSLGVVKPSLMAAYSATSFGIIFVSIFKIFNLRPLSRKLLLEAEMETTTAPAPLAEPSYAQS